MATAEKTGTTTTAGTGRVRTSTPPPRGFDLLTATKRDLTRHGLPPRPDPHAQPGLAALWDRYGRLYRDYEHLAPVVSEPAAPPAVTERAAGLSLFPGEQAGFELFSPGGTPITVVSGSWTVPGIRHNPTPLDPVRFRTFFGLGFLDIHVEMTVDAAEVVTATVTIHTGATVNLPVRPGDTLHATMCLQTNPAGTAFYFIANQTTGQTVNFTIDTGFPPAVTVDAGISRGYAGLPFNPLVKFGTVYFDELSLFSTGGPLHLPNGTATSMVDSSGHTVALTERLTDFTFRIVHQGS